MPPTASLNPASVPFFPGTTQRNGHSSDDERGISPAPGVSASGQSLNHLQQQQQQQQRLTPSPMPMAAETSSGSGPIATGQGPIRFQQSPPQAEWMRASPLSRSMDSDKAVYSFMPPPHETRLPPNLSSSSLSQSPPLDDFQSIDSVPISSSASSSASLAGPFRQNSAGTHAMAIGITQNGPRGSLANIHGGNTGIGNNSPNPLISAGISASPVSSLGSSSHFTTALEYVPPPSAASASSASAASLDAQLRTSPVIRDIFDRLARCENVTRRISEELFEVHRKVDVLVDRALNPPLTAVAEDFKDPFAPPGASGTISARPSVSGGLGGPGMNGGGDDITQISQRLNTLTSSVGQLLAIQTQQLGANVGPRHGTATPPLDLAPNQLPGPHLSHGRPSISRGLNPPMRTWSAGSLDLPPMRGQDMPQMPRGSDLLRADKGRRSVSNVLRRDSAGDAMMGRDGAGGPTIGKWEQLNLAPELLRSLTKFGVGPPNKIQQRALPFLLRGSDIIAQAPPTQERIAAYVIPAIHVALIHAPSVPRPAPGPVVVMVSTTVDQATQAQRMIRDLGGPIGIRSGLGVGAGTEVAQELRLLQQSMPHILCGTPQKLHALFTAPGAISGAHVRLLVLDEVDQLIARNLHEFLFGIVKLLPSPRSSSPSPNQVAETVDRQTALFSNTVPQDVLNLATAIQLREPVRVLVRRDGNVTHTDTAQSARGLRQFYLYLAFTAGGARDRDAGGAGLGIIGSGRGGAGTTSAESVQAREWKLDALADLFEDVDVGSAIVHVGGMASLDAVAYKLASRGLVAVPLHSDMNASVKMAALNKFRTGGRQQGGTRVLVVYDVQVKSPEVAHVPLVINYDLPKAVEEYAHRVASAIAPPGSSRAGVVVNFVTATGGDVEMLRSIECFYKIKCPEVPMSLRDVF